MIFVDSDAYIALYSKDDTHHKKALAISELLDGDKERLITSWDVIDEVSTKLSRFDTKNIAVDFLDKILRSQTTIVFPDNKLLKSAVKFFKHQTSKRVSFTDCANMAIAKDRKVEVFFSFDNHYVKNGFKLLK